jgi:hypothetical protein
VGESRPGDGTLSDFVMPNAGESSVSACGDTSPEHEIDIDDVKD